MAVLRALASEKSHKHRGSFVGCEIDVITLHTSPEMAACGRTVALTENFLPVELMGQMDANRLVRVRVTGLCADAGLQAVEAKAEFVPALSL
jgi:hypothetical protein